MENKNENKETYTLGIWKVKPGKEADFINAWTSFAKWTNQNCSGAGKAYLLRDENDSSRFISFSPWDSENSIRKWRDRKEFADFVANAKTLCDDFQPNTLKVVSASK
jgi:heme-degrading monooxygenase HmoA